MLLEQIETELRRRGRPYEDTEIESGVGDSRAEVSPLEQGFINFEAEESESEGESMIAKNESIIGAMGEPGLQKYKRYRDEGDIFSQRQRARILRLKGDVFFEIFNFLGVLELNAVIPSVCVRMGKLIHWYKSIAREMTLEVIDPRLY